MDWLIAAGDVLASGGLGAIVGGVFSWVQKREERKNLELELAHEKEMANIDRLREEADQKHALALADKGMEQAALEGQIATDVADAELREATVTAQAMPSGHPLIDGVLRFVRPVITLYLLAIVSIIGANLHSLTGGLEALPSEDLFQLYTHIVQQTVFLAVTAVTWWFGARGVSSGKQ